MRRLRVGISTCPNDTFAFHGLLSGAVEIEGLELDVELTDIEALNEGLLAGRWDVAKVSAHAAVAAAERVRCLPVGWALGFGIGPVVLARDADRVPERPRVLCPGAWTTATLLWRLFHPEAADVRQCVFSEILPALARGEADLGVCIHEARFTYRERGLALVEDLGATWEHDAGAPLPLGGLVASRALDAVLVARVVGAVRRSIEHGYAAPDEALVTMRRHARESDDAVLWKHVELYVNEHTLDLGREGRRALDALSRLGTRRGLLAAGAPLELFDGD